MRRDYAALQVLDNKKHYSIVFLHVGDPKPANISQRQLRYPV